MARNSIFLLSVSYLFLLSINPSLELDVSRFARNHLKTFGYLPNEYSSVDETYDEALVSALRTYQTFYGLNVTGRIEPDTLASMKRPRCGVPDLPSTGHMHNITAQYTFIKGRPTWPPSKRALPYGFSSPLIFPLFDLMSLLDRAFGQWAYFTKFEFGYGGSEKTDISIGFYAGSHGDGYPFDGPRGILAHAFPPTRGVLHFDAAEEWSTFANATQFDLESVALHEIGHILGMGHSSDSSAVMYAYYNRGEIKRFLQSDDVNGIRALYPDG